MSATLVAEDLVGTALLGTDRRPPEGVADPAHSLLDEAVRRRAQRQLVVGGEQCPAPEHGPPQRMPLPPVAARVLLDEILTRPGSLAVDLWLGEAAAYGCGLAPEHWTPVLDLAARQSTLDRHRVVTAMGDRGRWFARHNAAWSRVLQAGSLVADRRPAPADGLGVVDAGVLLAEPDRVFAVPDPWPESVGQAVLDVLAAGTMPWRAATAYGTAVGVRFPLRLYARVGRAMEHLGLVRARPGPSTARAGLVALDDVVWMRLVLRRAFDPDQPLPDRHAITESRS